MLNTLFDLSLYVPDALVVDSVRSFTVERVERDRVEAFIEQWHYSGKMNGVNSEYCFGLYHQRALIGAAVFAQPATAGVEKSYADKLNGRMIELRRLCCIDSTPRNTESYFIGQMLKWLKRNTDIEIVLAYSDLTYGHFGIIYQASNFERIGAVPPIDVIEFEGHLYHDRSLRVKYHGRLKPFARRLKAALDNGLAKRVTTLGKNIYVYRIDRQRLAGARAAKGQTE